MHIGIGYSTNILIRFVKVQWIKYLVPTVEFDRSPEVGINICTELHPATIMERT